MVSFASLLTGSGTALAGQDTRGIPVPITTRKPCWSIKHLTRYRSHCRSCTETRYAHLWRWAGRSPVDLGAERTNRNDSRGERSTLGAAIATSSGRCRRVKEVEDIAEVVDRLVVDDGLAHFSSTVPCDTVDINRGALESERSRHCMGNVWNRRSLPWSSRCSARTLPTSNLGRRVTSWPSVNMPSNCFEGGYVYCL